MTVPQPLPVFVSIHAPNEGSDLVSRFLTPPCKVSIHAPNEGSDCHCRIIPQLDYVSIHAPNEGSDVDVVSLARWHISFNPRSQ